MPRLRNNFFFYLQIINNRQFEEFPMELEKSAWLEWKCIQQCFLKKSLGFKRKKKNPLLNQ